MAEDYHDLLGGELEAQRAAYGKALGRAEPEIADGECRTFLRKHGLPIDPTTKRLPSGFGEGGRT